MVSFTITIDPETSKVVFIDSISAEMLGYTQNEIIDKTIFEIISNEMRTEAENCIKNLKSGKVSIVNLFLKKKNGQIMQTETKFIPGKFNGKEVYIGFSQDLNRKKMIESAEKAFNSLKNEIAEKEKINKMIQKKQVLIDSLIELNPNAIALFDHEGDYVKVNQAFTMLIKLLPPKNTAILNNLVFLAQNPHEEMNRLKKGEIISLPERDYNPHEDFKDEPDIDFKFRTINFPVMDEHNQLEYIASMTQVRSNLKKENC